MMRAIRKKSRLFVMPLQRKTSGLACGRCGAQGVELEPDDAVEDAMRCAISDIGAYAACHEVWRPHCPIWCSGGHDLSFEYRDGKWFHHTRALDVTVSRTSADGAIDVVPIELCVFETAGGEFEEPVIHLGDTGMRPDEARAFAKAFVTVANLADLTTALTKRS
jgi:hypothetical protein